MSNRYMDMNLLLHGFIYLLEMWMIKIMIHINTV
jgi:hypothetical protein